MIRHAGRMGLPSLCVLVGIASFLFPQSQIQIGYTFLAADSGSSVPVRPALQTAFNYPRGIALDKSGSLYIADSYNHRIRAVRGPLP